MSSINPRIRVVGAIAALATIALLASCRGFFPPEQLGTMTITPTSPNVPLGGTTQLSVYGTNTDNSSAGNITGKVSWTSSSGAVGVNSAGVLTGNDLSSTPASITAQYQGITATASATVCVENGTNFTITFSPSNTVTEGQLVSITATASVSGVSGPVDISSGVTWSTSNTNLTVVSGDPATIDTSVLGTITSPVTTTVFAVYTCNGINSNFQATLTINP